MWLGPDPLIPFILLFGADGVQQVLLHSLQKFLQQPNNLFVGVGIANDLKKLFTDFEFADTESGIHFLALEAAAEKLFGHVQSSLSTLTRRLVSITSQPILGCKEEAKWTFEL
jgi:hypothetical protein